MKKILFFFLLSNLGILFGQNISPLHPQAGTIVNHSFDNYFQNAYTQNPKVPRGILEAVAFTMTRIHHLSPTPFQSCVELPPVYGVMGLTLDGKNYFRNNLLLISEVSGVSAEDIISDPQKNILAFARAYSYFLEIKNISSAKIENHLPVLISLSELPDNDLQSNFALNSHLYSVLIFLNSPENQKFYGFPEYHIDLKEVFGEENYHVLQSPNIEISEGGIKNKDGVQYKNDGNNPSFQSTDYSSALWNTAATCNYSQRGGTAVSAVVIHDVEGSYAGCISWFKNCSASVSAHYVVRSSDGQITQMVLESNKAWHVGTHNPYTIGIEHEGYQSQTGWYTTAMYNSSANLVKDICNSGYGINPSTCYSGPACNGICTLSSTYKIKGHQHYSSQTHNDPGPNWDWGNYYNLIIGNTACGTPAGLNASSISSSGAIIGWSSVTGATNYTLNYRKTLTSSWTSVTSSTNSIAVSGLTSSTGYEYQVQTICSGATGNFSPISTFSTASVVVSNDNCSGAQSLNSATTCVSYTGNIAGATASGMAKAGCDVFTGTPQLKDVWFSFTANNPSHIITLTPSSGLDAVLVLYSSCNGTQVGCSDNGGGPGGIEKITTTALTAGTNYFLRIYSYGSATPSTTTFNICITHPQPPSCGIPSGLSSGSVTSSGATLTWNSVSGAASYNVRYKPTSSSTWATITTATASKIISGLSPSTAYEFQVQTVCSGSNGSFSASSTFTTLTANTSSTISIGNGTSAYSAHPYSTAYMDEKVEYIVSASELTAAGWSASTPEINSISFYVSSASAQLMNSFTISLSQTSSAFFGNTTFITGTNSKTVFSGNATANAGWNNYSFSSPFIYSGTSNLLITICWNNNGFTTNSSVMATSYSNYTALYYRADLSASGVCSQGTGTLSYYRPNMKLVFSSGTGSQNNVNCDLSLKTTIEGFDVYKHNPSGAIMFKAKMAIDADGSPRAYGPNNSGLDYTANAGSPGNWWGVVTDGSGNPVLQNSTDPYPGMYVSTTSLINSSYSVSNPLRYANSETVPFYVLPSAVTSIGGISLGDIAYVFNSSNGLGCYAVFADGGPSGKLGEGSISLANKLGINSNPKNGGTSSGIIDYIVFPQSGFGQGTIPSNAKIDSLGTVKINSVGGTGITNCLDNPSSNKQEDFTGMKNEEMIFNEGLNIYPNPSDGMELFGELNHQMNGENFSKTGVEIFDITGRKIYSDYFSLTNNKFQLNISEKGIKKGIYLLVVETPNGKISKKLLVN